jgi:5-methylcytosine-specific restriction enzyme A
MTPMTPMTTMPKRPCLDCDELTEGSVCADCRRARMRRDPMHSKTANARYGNRTYRSNRKRALRRDGHRCRRCGATEGVQTHHIVPIPDGGSHHFSNLVSLCPRCHAKVEAETRRARGGGDQLEVGRHNLRASGTRTVGKPSLRGEAGA